MFKHLLATVLRGFRRHWMTSGIGVLGLTLGFFCVMGSLNLIHYFELDDDQYSDAARTYFVAHQYQLSGPEAVPMIYRSAPIVAADELEAAIPNVGIARIVDYGLTPVTFGTAFFDVRVRIADRNLFEIFQFPFAFGNPASSLTEPRSAVITRATAIRLFGTDEVIGRSLLVHGNESVTITGVIAEPAAPTHFLNAMSARQTERMSFELLLSMDMLVRIRARQSDFETVTKQLKTWGNTSATIYVRLPADGSVDRSALDAALGKSAALHGKDSIPRKLFSKPIAEFRQIGFNELVSSDVIGMSWSSTLMWIAGVILLVATLNYANLATAIGDHHRREQGIRRVLGASPAQLVAQNALESAVTAAVAFLLATALIATLNPWLREARQIDLLYVWLHSKAFWTESLTVVLLTALAACIAPIVATSRVRASTALQHSRGGVFGSRGVRWLVGAQFALAGVLLVFVVVVRSQQQQMVEHARLSIPAPIVAIQNNLRAAGVDFKVLRTELLKQAHIEAVTSTGFTPWGRTYALTSITSSLDAGSREASAINEPVGDEYFSTLEIRLLAGREFSDAIRVDSATRSEFPVVIDQRLAEHFGWARTGMAIGHLLYPGNAVRGTRPGVTLRVIGVVENNTKQFSTQNGVESTIYTSNRNAGIRPLVRVSRNHLAEAQREIENVWRSLAPNSVIRAEFLDEIVVGYVAATALYSNALAYLTFLALAIAVSGLIGMAIHMVNRRTHEIGVRKTLGAKAVQIVSLLLKEIARPIVAGTVIGWPLAFWLSQTYLNIYLHRIELTLWPFALALFGVLVVGLGVVSWHAYKAAGLKPADVLRHE